MCLGCVCGPQVCVRVRVLACVCECVLVRISNITVLLCVETALSS